MKIDKKYKIEKLVNLKKSNIYTPYLDKQDKDKAAMVATNGVSLAVVPVQDAGNDVKSCIDVDIYKEGRKLAKNDDNIEFELTEDEIATKSNTYARSKKNYITWRRLFPEKTKSNAVTIDVKELKKLADALGDNVLTLTILEKMGAIQVETDDAGAYGLIMPMDLQNKTK